MGRLGQKLKELRGSLSTYEIEKESGISSAELSRYENGKHLPTPRKLQQLADYYGVKYEELRELWYDDHFSDPKERAIVLKWAEKIQQGLL